MKIGQFVTRMVLCLLIHLFSVAASRGPSSWSSQKPQLLTTVPFRQLIGGVVIIQAKLNQYPDTLNFILDTGSAGISLDSTTCARLQLPVTPSDRIIRGIGGVRAVSYALNNSLLLPNLKIDSLDFHINNYDQISSVYGIQVDGIIGYGLFSRYIVRVDYDKEMIELYSAGKFEYEKGGELLKPVMGQIPVLPFLVKNPRPIHAKYYFDTGAGLCLLLSREFVKDSSLLRMRRRPKVTKTEAQGLGGKMELDITTVQEIKFGGYQFRNVPAYIFDDVANVTAYPYLGGVIGNDLLRRFNLTLNYQEKEIYIIPNTHFRDPFDYSYTGLIFYFIEGKCQVTDVIVGSPAEKAGFKAGDIIVAVDNNFSNNIQQYREILKDVGSKVRIIILRDGKLDSKKLPIKSIL